ncbi:hypothetical protein INS49_003106 [Diaporthe citri]|uniref:uncharacterized protein n=1 Tax=Diaporthe citri TaxID=83186 RepID=UPI001C804AA1|nr:uncharacterized protein INS49_003106 [Diaporthe citri]KAG6368888.1 hypothetical protein INS49_003106 [Diaporthe citri]
MEIFTVNSESPRGTREKEDAAVSPTAEGSRLGRSIQGESACSEQEKDSGQEEDSGDQQCESQLGGDDLVDNDLGRPEDAGTTSGPQNLRSSGTHVNMQSSISLRPDPSCVTLTLSTGQLAELAQTLGRRVEEATVATVSAGLMRRVEDAFVTTFAPAIQRMVEEATAKAISGRRGTKRKRPGKQSGRYENEDDEDEVYPDEDDEDEYDEDESESDGDRDVNGSVHDALDFTADPNLDRGNTGPASQRRLWGRQDSSFMDWAIA